MALAIAIAAEIFRLRRAAAAGVVFGLLSVVPAAPAAEHVYIWRDASGIVRFSSVEQVEQDIQCQPEPPVRREGDVQSRVAATDE